MRKIIGEQSVRVLIIIVCLASVTVGTAVAAVQVSGDFSGTMVGYGENANVEAGDDPNQITVDGSLSVEEEAAVDPVIRITSGSSTVLDTTSVEALVPSEQAVNLEKRPRQGAVVLIPEADADRIPAGTTIDISYNVYFKGGTTKENINAGTVNIEYESPGGTRGSNSFSANTNVKNSPDRIVSQLETSSSISWIQNILSYVGGFAVIILVIVSVYYIIKSISGRKTPDDNGRGGGGPP